MVEALTLERLEKDVRERYKDNKSRVVGIMLARYNKKDVQKIIEEDYLYWDKKTGKKIDVFWAGYGAYLNPAEESETKKILKYEGNTKRDYFDLDAFISISEELNKHFKKPYKDKIQLALVNYYDGKLHFEESIQINFNDNSRLEELIEDISDKCGMIYDVQTLAAQIQTNKILDRFKDIKLSDLINAALNLFGFTPK